MKKSNFLYLVWKNPQNKRTYTVGKLEKKSVGFSFEYWGDFKKACDDGWGMIRAFPEVKKYESKNLFPVFSSRLPDRKRRNIEDVLRKYGLTSYDGYELLKQSGGKLPIDTFEFVKPDVSNDSVASN